MILTAHTFLNKLKNSAVKQPGDRTQFIPVTSGSQNARGT